MSSAIADLNRASDRSRSRTDATRPRFRETLGLHSGVTRTNLVAFLVHCSCSILFLVFLNVSQPFVIHQLYAKIEINNGHGDVQKAGALSGTLIFSDELLSTLLALLWGAAADLYGFSRVVPVAYIFVALGLLAYTIPSRPWPDLLVARLIFAVGGSGATAMLSAILAGFSHLRTKEQQRKQPARPLRRAHLIPQESAASSDVNSQLAARPPDQAIDEFVELETDLPGDEDFAATHDSQETVRAPSSKPGARSNHGRLAALAGIFTGLGALLAVFGLLQIPAALARYFDRSADDAENGGEGDIAIRRATVATFVIVAALSLLVAIIMALGLGPHRGQTSSALGQRRAGHTVEREVEGYGALQDSTITIQSDSREARRSRLRHRLQSRERSGWLSKVKQTLSDFARSALGGFHLVRPVRQRVGTSNATYQSTCELATELRMAYLGGALARACTIGTTAFLPLLITQHYYTSGLCTALPSPDPDSPLPSDSLKQLCRQAFTATAVLGGTAQLSALLLSPLVGLLCDRLTPTLTLTFSSAVGAGGFALLAIGTNGLGGDRRTGEEVPDPLSTLSILSAVAIGFGQIGAIVASLASCARARANQVEQERRTATLSAVARSRQDDETLSEADTLVPDRDRRLPPAAMGELEEKTGSGPGAIAGAYTCTGSISILLVSKLGGTLFDLFAPAPFLLIAGLSTFVALAGLITSLVRFRARQAPR